MTRSAIAKTTACALGITIALAGPAIRVAAQQQPNSGVGIDPSQQEAQPQAPPALASPPHLFGDWDGFRTDLGNLGINLNLDYTTESAGNIAGGLRRGVDYAQQIGIQIDVDWEKLADIPGFSTHLAVVNRAGRNLSTDYIGDKVLQAQEIFGAGFDMAVHDVWFYGEEKLFNGRVDAVFGRIFPGMDFAASPLSRHLFRRLHGTATS